MAGYLLQLLGSRFAASPPLNPGPQKLLKRSWLGSSAIWMLILLVAVLFVHAFLQANFKEVEPGFISEVKVLDTNDALTLLVALLSLVAVRQQFIHSLQPYLSYERRPTEAPQHLTGAKGEVYWTCHVRNFGPGIAFVQSVWFELSMSDQHIGWNSLNYDQVVERLASQKITIGKDFSLVNFSNGAIIGTADKQLLLEIRDHAARRIKILDMRIRYRSIAGDWFEKTIYCIPRNVDGGAAGSSVRGGTPDDPGTASQAGAGEHTPSKQRMP